MLRPGLLFAQWRNCRSSSIHAIQPVQKTVIAATPGIAARSSQDSEKGFIGAFGLGLRSMSSCIAYFQIIGTALLVFSLHQGTTASARERVEEVYVARINTNDDRAVIARRTGETYVIEKGDGCISLWRYEGGRVVVMSQTQFLGVGSKLFIPDAHQVCSVWEVSRGKLWERPAWLPPHLSYD